ncbi:DUF4136 domain-containing protein [Pontibacter actiniarum]|nr:DUF4136 domain-containing protein [Pontibacter actiniarum]
MNSRMKVSHLYTILLLLFTLAGCARIAPETSYSYIPNVNFREYSSFDWYKAEVPKPIAGGAGTQFNLLLDQNIKEAIASELVKEGVRPELDDPDIVVAYDIAVDTSLVENAGYSFPSSMGYGYSYWYGYRHRYSPEGMPNFRPIQAYPPGTVVVDIINPRTNQLLWRGAAFANFDPTSLELDEERISLVVAEIMSQFPPTPDITR